MAVISYAFWQRRFGGSADVIGKPQTIDRVPFTIVGVMPPDFFGTDVGSRSDVILPIGTEPLMRGRDSLLDRAHSWLLVMARLKDDQTVGRPSRPCAASSRRFAKRRCRRPARRGAGGLPRDPFGVQSAAGGTSPCARGIVSRFWPSWRSSPWCC